MKGFFSKAYEYFAGTSEIKNQSTAQSSEAINPQDLKQFSAELMQDFERRDYSKLSGAQKDVLGGMQHRLRQYGKEFEKGGISEEKLGEMAREIFVISCASTKSMKDCLEFHEKCGFGVKELNDFTKDSKLNPLAAALAGGRDERDMNKLIEKGADVNFKSPDGNNLAHFAVTLEVGEKSMKFLIEKGVDINSENKAGMTALDFTKIGGSKDLANVLENNGGKIGSLKESFKSSVTQEKSKDKELADAVAEGKFYKTNSLIAHGADVNAVVEGGKTSVQIAAESGNAAITGAVAFYATVETKEKVTGVSDSMKDVVDNTGSQQTKLHEDKTWVQKMEERSGKSSEVGLGA